MSLLLVGALLAAAPMAPAAQAANADAALGMWKTETRGGVVEIQRCGASICGRIVTSELLRTEPNLKDSKNPDASLRNRPLKELLILSGFKADGNAWSGGTIYKADDGKTYKATVTPIDANTLKVRGCIFVPLCKTQTWTRVR
jgi:uncharacterized protein (DUF2147 family)